MQWCLDVGPLGGNCVYIRNEGGALMMGLVLLQEEKERQSLSTAQTKERPCENRARSQLSIRQEAGSHQTLKLLAT